MGQANQVSSTSCLRRKRSHRSQLTMPLWLCSHRGNYDHGRGYALRAVWYGMRGCQSEVELATPRRVLFPVWELYGGAGPMLSKHPPFTSNIHTPQHQAQQPAIFLPVKVLSVQRCESWGSRDPSATSPPLFACYFLQEDRV